MFEAKEYDDEFHVLNDQIARHARSITGFLGEESWHNEQSGLHSEVYYWDSLEALQQLIGMAEHKVAKAAHPRWIGAYRVVIAQVLTSYGQAGLGLTHVPSSATDRGSRKLPGK